MEKLDQKVNRVFPECQVSWDLRVIKDRLDLMAFLDPLDLLAPLERLVKRALLDPKDLLDYPDCRVSLERTERTASQARLGKQENQEN